MRVTVRFVDGEILEGDSDAATLSRLGFPMVVGKGNTQVAWVSLASIKYVLFRETDAPQGDTDPRAEAELTKIVLHFVDGEILRTFKDEAFSQEAEGFMLRLWDPDTRRLVRALVSLHALKAIFFVNQWDSRTDEELVRFSPGPATPVVEGLPDFVHRTASKLGPKSRSEETPRG